MRYNYGINPLPQEVLLWMPLQHVMRQNIVEVLRVVIKWDCNYTLKHS